MQHIPHPANTPSQIPTSPSTAPTPDAPHLTAIRRLMRVSRRHHASMERRIGDLGIHHSQHRMLVHLTRCTRTPSQKEIAETMGISPAAVATTLKRLEKEGYITRSATDEDNRRNHIAVTDKGLSKVAEGREIFETADRQLFTGFTSEDMETLIRLLEAMDRNLDAAGAPADPCGPRKT